VTEVERLDHWNTQNDMHFKELETEFKRLYKTIEVEDALHSTFLKRLDKSTASSKLKSIKAETHETLRGKQKFQFTKSRQAKEFEERLDKEYNAIEKHCQELKENVKRESTNVCDLRARHHELMSEKYKRNSTLAQEESNIRGMKKLNLAAFLLKSTVLQRRKSKTHSNYSLLLGSLQSQIDHALEKVEQSRSEIEVCKEKMRAIRAALIKHYLQILKEGTDCRSNGLMWVVLELWKCEVKVIPAMFPDFLDSKTAEVVILLAALEQEKHRLQAFLHEEYRGVNYEVKEGGNQPLNNIKSRLAKVRMESLTKHKTVTKYDRFTKEVRVYKEIVQGEAENDDYSIDHMRVRSDWNRIQEAESKLEALKTQMEEIQTKEVKRIAHDYFIMSSSIGPEKDRRLYLSAVSGSEGTERYLNLVRKGEREVKQLLEQVKTFSFSKA